MASRLMTLLGTTALSAVAWGGPASAQNTSQAQSPAFPAANAPYTAPVADAALVPPAGPAESSRGDASDIIVTARRVSERLENVPISITVFNNRQIADRNIVDPRDLVIYTPGLSTTGVYGRDNTQYAIRGFSQANRTAASVAVYFADVVAPRSGPSISAGDGAGPGQFLDLQNVQVLKGPQGTLFGRNTTGGAVLLVPTKPTSKFEGYVQGLYGNYDWKAVQGVLNIPLGKRARFRFAGDFEDRDGLTRNFGIGPKRLDDRHFVTLRASLVLDVTPDVENYTILSYSRSSTNGTANQLIGCDPAARDAGSGALLPTAILACGNPATSQLARQQARDVHTAENDLPDPFNRREQYGVINTTTWQASDTLTIKNIASYTELKSKVRYDVFGTNFTISAIYPAPTLFGVRQQPTGALAGTGLAFVDSVFDPDFKNSIADQYTLSEELQLQGRSSNNRLVYQAGGYFERSGPLNVTGQVASQLVSCTDLAALRCTDSLRQIIQAANEAALNLPAGTLAAAVPAIGSVSKRSGSISYRNLGIYGQATYSITDQLKLTAGVRYTDDRTKAYNSATNFAFINPAAPRAICIKTIANLADNCAVRFKQHSHKPTWLVGLDFKPIDDVLLYAKYTRGYRQGSVSPDAADGYETFRPETVDAYEAGTKISLRGPVRGYFNVSGFYNDLKNQQIGATFTPLLGSQTDGIVNAGKSRIFGAEVEALVIPIQGLSLTVSYTYLNTKLKSIAPIVVDPAVYRVATPTVVAGQDLTNSPHHKFTGSATYQLPVDKSIGRVSVGGVFSYTSAQLYAFGAGPFQRQPGFHTINLNVNWDSVAGSLIDLEVFATNVTNEKYRNFIFGIYNSAGIEVAQYGEQRIYGAKLRYRFGR